MGPCLPWTLVPAPPADEDLDDASDDDLSGIKSEAELLAAVKGKSIRSEERRVKKQRIDAAAAEAFNADQLERGLRQEREFEAKRREWKLDCRLVWEMHDFLDTYPTRRRASNARF